MSGSVKFFSEVRDFIEVLSIDFRSATTTSSEVAQTSNGVVDFLPILSFFGILLTIVISLNSLNIQRSASARESLEQLDDIDIQSSIRLKPILHRYSSWPRGKAEVKIKVYQNTDIAGVGRLKRRFLAFEGHILQEYDVCAEEDGYILSVDSSNPVKIRRQVNELLQVMANSGRLEKYHWMTFEDFEKVYQPAMNGEKTIVHEEIIEVIESRGASSVRDLHKILSNEPHFGAELERFGRGIVRMGISDLVGRDELQKDPDNSSKYILKQ